MISKDNLIQEIIWYLDEHTALELSNLIEEANDKRNKLLEIKPNLNFNHLNNPEITKDDYLLKFVLTHKITAGERHSVLFKNLAPILVKLNLDKDKKILDQIIKNCPGKSTGELMGWIKLARKGKLHLNIREINKWSEKYGYLS